MKRLMTIWWCAGALALALAMSACNKDQYEIYDSPEGRLNFLFYTENEYYETVVAYAEDVTDEMRTYAFSFVFSGMEAERDTVWFSATTMGYLSGEYRPYALRQIRREGVKNAEPGVHYVAFDDPEVQDLYRVAPDSNTVQVPVIVLRDDPALQDTTVVLEFGFADNGVFMPGYAGLDTRILEITDRLAIPENWVSSDLDKYVGAYSELKHQLMIEWTGEAWDADYIAELMSANADRAYVEYLAAWFAQRLEEENAIREANGEEPYDVDFTGEPWI